MFEDTYVFVILSLSLAVVMLVCFLAGMVVVAAVLEARDWRRRRRLLDEDIDASRDYSQPRVVP
jgi:uncharacterized integral membrane protein